MSENLLWSRRHAVLAARASQIATNLLACHDLGADGTRAHLRGSIPARSAWVEAR